MGADPCNCLCLFYVDSAPIWQLLLALIGCAAMGSIMRSEGNAAFSVSTNPLLNFTARAVTAEGRHHAAFQPTTSAFSIVPWLNILLLTSLLGYHIFNAVSVASKAFASIMELNQCVTLPALTTHHPFSPAAPRFACAWVFMKSFAAVG